MKHIHHYAARFFIVLTWSLFSFTCLGQINEKTNRSIIKFNVASAVDMFSFPAIQFSYERRLNKRISLAAEFGYQFYQIPGTHIDTSEGQYFSAFTNNSDTSFVSPSGFKANIECRYYFVRRISRRKHEISVYAALNLFYRRNKTDIAILYLKDQVSRAIDCYWMQRTNLGAMQVVGMQFIYKRITLELYSGVGIADRKVLNYNREYNQDTDLLLTNRHDVIGQERKFLSEFNGGTPALSAGFRIGIPIN